MSPPGEPTDHAVMARIQSGDEIALGILLRRYWGGLVTYAQRFVDDGAIAEDLTQEAFVRLWESREGWTPEGSVRGYLYTITRNLCLNEREKRSVREDWARRERFRSSSQPTPADVLDERETARVLLQEIERLPVRRREIFELGCLHGLSYREIAETLGVAIPTVANQMSAAIKHLRSVVRALPE